jgi:hypothetical protein
MKRITFALAAALTLGALTLALPKLKSEVKAKPAANPAAPQLIPGPKTCTNVKFKFTNMRSDKATIRIQKVTYRMLGKDYTELVNTSNDCKYGSTCTTNGNNLPDADGRDLTSFHLVYKFLDPTIGSKWSSLVQTPALQADNPECSDDRVYGPGSQGWRIPPQ